MGSALNCGSNWMESEAIMQVMQGIWVGVILSLIAVELQRSRGIEVGVGLGLALL